MQRFSTGIVLAVVLTVVAVSALVASVFVAYQTIPNSGNVKTVGVGVYWDSNCTSNVTSIDWGFVVPGQNVNVTVYIKSKGTIPVSLNMTTNNWNPSSASRYITVSWNCEGYTLNTTSPKIQATITLLASANITEVANFSFDIIITGTEH